jgi:predicted DNA binding CopG/RHH family protein
MSSPKKKLPTGPIRINPPVTHHPRTATASIQPHALKESAEAEFENQKLEEQKQDSGIHNSIMVESSMLYPTLPELSMDENGMLDSLNQVDRLQEATIEESAQEESSQIGVASQSVRIESGIPESGLTETEYKKVAMRLSSEAVENLRQLRATTGVPYEILVDVMIRNWDKLPQRTKAAYLQEAKQVRAERLIAGQEKTMKTMRTKYLSQ